MSAGHDNAVPDSVWTETVFSDVTQFLTTGSPSDGVLNAISSPYLIRITPRKRIESGGKAPQILNAGRSWITHFLLHARSLSRYALDWSPIGHRTGLDTTMTTKVPA